MSKLLIDCNFISHDEIKNHINSHLISHNVSLDDITYELKPQRDGEASLLIVLISTSGFLLNTLTNGLIKLALTKKAQTIKIKGKNFEIVIPANSTETEIYKYINIAKKSDCDTIVIQNH